MNRFFVLILSVFTILSGCKSNQQQGADTAPLIVQNSADSFEILVNQEAHFILSVHGSVGFDATVESADQSILQHLDTEFQYNKKPEPGMTGGDAGKKTFIFKGIKPGETSITITKIFRGEVEEIREIKATVSAP